ncbi:MAG: hypothetical protein WBD75_12070 [Phycisphaerae bacterium]|nr:hypothetical protein [Phycisphaerae bacterium]
MGTEVVSIRRLEAKHWRTSRQCHPPFAGKAFWGGNTPVLFLLLAAALAAGCGERQTRLEVYLNLMTPLQQADYRLLEAEGKPVSLRLAYLQEIGVYQKWAEQPKDIQDAILRRRVVEGMMPLQVRMAWGEPTDRREAALPEERAAGHTKEIWDYVLTSRKSGDEYQQSVCFLDGAVLWVRTP